MRRAVWEGLEDCERFSPLCKQAAKELKYMIQQMLPNKGNSVKRPVSSGGPARTRDFNAKALLLWVLSVRHHEACA